MVEIAPDQPVPQPNLTELTGQIIDSAAYRQTREPLLETHGWTWQSYAARQLALNAPLIAKVAKHGVRAPAAPYLTAVAEQLERLLYMVGATPTPEDALSETLAYFDSQIDEARSYYND